MKMTLINFFKTNTYFLIISLQIDPARAVPGEDPEENAQTLSDFCHLFLNTITSSIKHCPMYRSSFLSSSSLLSSPGRLTTWHRSFRAVCYHLQREVMKKFPQSKYIVLTVRVRHLLLLLHHYHHHGGFLIHSVCLLCCTEFLLPPFHLAGDREP